MTDKKGCKFNEAWKEHFRGVGEQLWAAFLHMLEVMFDNTKS